MENVVEENPSPSRPNWRKVAYGGMQPGYNDNYTDESFLEGMVMNANVMKRDMLKVMQDSVSITQYLCIVALVVCVWTYTLGSTISEASLLLLDASLLGSGFLVLLTAKTLSLHLLFHYHLNISFFISGLYVLAPIYHNLTRSISSDSIWALIVSLLIVHLFLHDYSGSTIRPPGALTNPTLTSNISLNASIVASVLIASRLPSRLHVFAIVLFSLQVFLFAPRHILHQEVLFRTAPWVLVWVNGGDLGVGVYSGPTTICTVVRSIDFCHSRVPVLAYKNSGVQV